MASDSYHEPLDLLSEDVRNVHRAIVSLMEELEAIDWYGQRAEACSDANLKTVLLHNREEEIEHAMMVLEWIRRHCSDFDTIMRKYLFTTQPVTEIEAGAESAAAGASAATLGIGSLKGG
jgi:ferritin-like protein